jgi:hypothetical protein
MKNQFLLILLFCSFALYGQLRYDSLERICIEQFNKDKHIYPYRECKGCIVGVNKELDDTFGRYILLGAHNLDSSYVDSGWSFSLHGGRFYNPISRVEYMFRLNTEYLVYMLDIYTGEIISVEDYKTFNKIINTSKEKLYNLEKCTLYLLLNHKGCYGLSQLLRGYPKDIKQSKKLLSLQFMFAGFGGRSHSEIENPEWLCDKVKQDQANSNNNNIVVYEFLSDTSEYLACRYQFLFDFTDNISSINKEYLKRGE